MIRSTLELTNSSICARCFRESFCASLKIILMFGCFSAAFLTSVFIWTRQGSPRLHWLIPITYCFSAARAARPNPNTSQTTRSFFMASSGWSLADSLEEDRSDDDGSRQHQATRFTDSVDTQDLLEIANGHCAHEREQHAAPAAIQARTAHDHDGDRGQLVGAPSLRVALLLLDGLADAGHGAEEAAHHVGQQLDALGRDSRQSRRLLVAAGRIEIPSPAEPGEEHPTDADAGEEDQRHHRDVVAQDLVVDRREDARQLHVLVAAVGVED